MAAPVSEYERARIVDYLREGKTQGWIARETGRSKQTVSRIARDEGIKSDVTATKKAEAARLDYDLAARLIVINEGFDKLRDVLKTITDPRELQAWTVALGTLIDKRRLEDGQATNRTENVDPASREKIKGTLHDLAERRRMAG
jgi:hypothetical protein